MCIKVSQYASYFVKDVGICIARLRLPTIIGFVEYFLEAKNISLIFVIVQKLLKGFLESPRPGV
jgi:hypothetical protein